MLGEIFNRAGDVAVQLVIGPAVVAGILIMKVAPDDGSHVSQIHNYLTPLIPLSFKREGGSHYIILPFELPY
jgi:hypothetical protein